MAAMGRRRTRNLGLPPHMAQKGRSFYYVMNSPRRWIPLGDDWPAALAAWAKLEGEPTPESARTFSQVAAWYRKDELPKKAPRTRKDNEAELLRLEAVFGDSPIETIEPADVGTYLERRADADGKPAPIRANREIALLSHVFNFARRRRFTSAANPCAGIERNQETGRDRYVDDAEFEAIYAKADPVLQDALDLLLLTGQRPGDVLRMKRADLAGGALRVKQGKTGTKLRITVEGELAAALERMQGRARKATGLNLIQDDEGQPLTYWMLENRFAKARAAAALELPAITGIQLRDLRGKAATDTEDLAHAQKLLGHASRAMTEHYTKQRAGERVAPLKRKPRP
jgi:integrase